METEITEKLKKIFNVKKVVFDQPGESQEQQCLFIEVENCIGRVKDGRETARVSAVGVMFGSADKMPLNYFAKCIDKAEVEDKKDFAFFEFEQNTRIFQNIVERSFRFVYFYNSQYDPARGSITSTTVNVEVTE